MKLKSITIFRKGLGLMELDRKEWAKLFDELYEGDDIEIVEVHY